MKTTYEVVSQMSSKSVTDLRDALILALQAVNELAPGMSKISCDISLINDALIKGESTLASHGVKIRRE
jgi:hypothetical protein